MWRRRGTLGLAAVVPLGMTLLTACIDSDAVVEPQGVPGQVTWRIRFNHDAVTMAVGQSVQLVATPITVLGAAVDPVPVVTWSSTNVPAARVDQDGTVHADAVGSNVSIIATVRDSADNISRADTVLVNVTATADPLTSFGFVVTPGTALDSGRVGAGVSVVIPVPVVAEGTSGNPVNVAYRQWFGASSVGTARFYGVSGIQPLDTGRVVMYARTFAYGTEYVDSLAFTVAPAINVIVQVYDQTTLQMLFSSQPGIITISPTEYNLRILPANVTVRRGGTVLWQNLATLYTGGAPIPEDKLPKINFESLDGVVPAENVICAAYPAPQSMRQFTKEGVYRWSNPSSGQSGTITVTP
jgi:hypothetical protein